MKIIYVKVHIISILEGLKLSFNTKHNNMMRRVPGDVEGETPWVRTYDASKVRHFDISKLYRCDIR